VSQKEARECDAVIDLLRTSNLKILRINLCDFPERSTLALPYPHPSTFLYVDDAKEKRLNDCNVGWIHRLPPVSTSQSLSGLSREISMRESESLTCGLLLSLPCMWINDLHSIWRSSHKPYQLAVASKFGLPVPPTLISNDGAKVIDFIQANKGRVVMKNLHSGYIEFGGSAYKAYTRLLTQQDILEINNLSYGPCIFQACVDKVRDLRITYVDGEIFPTAIYCGDLSHEQIDIRTLDFDLHKSRFSVAPISRDLASACSDIASALDLRYVGFDFVESRSGELFFLEANALGSFMWIERMTGQRISEALERCILRLAGS
jgi:glutathione synthase/RimK-type ligase-like ATP-grasp enzyme